LLRWNTSAQAVGAFGLQRRAAVAALPQDARHAAAQQVLLLVAELMPRLVPALTSKARVEVLPLLQLLICCHPAAEARKHMLALLVNLVPSPDVQQRQVC
jgi:hypothetical protein